MDSGFDIILSYRRDDSGGYAGRLYDALVQRFGEEHVFRDINAIDPGVDFTVAIERAVASASVFLAMIGPRWRTLTDDHGRRRIDAPGDVVRFEIESALHRDVLVIPLLVDDAEMPSSDELPQSIAPLAFRNALELRDRSWRQDVDRLIETIEEVRREGSSHRTDEPGRARN